jgi:hypothetical protein
LNYPTLNIDAMPCVSQQANGVAWVNGSIDSTAFRFLNNKPLPCASLRPKSLHINMLDMEVPPTMCLQEDGVSMLHGTATNFLNH